EFTRDQRKRNLYARKNPLRVMPKDKRQSVHENPSTHGAVLRVHPDAVEVGTLMDAGGAKYLGVSGIVFSLVVLFVVVLMGIGGIDWFYFIMLLPLSLLMLFSLWMIRRGLFSPEDNPVLFNRRDG